MTGILPKLSRDYIESCISQIEIFAKYLDISMTEIHNCIDHNNLIISPLREDKNPTCGFYYTSNKLRFNDFAGYFHGDCYDVVGYRNLLNSRDSVEFAKIMDIIARDFKIHKYKNIVYDFDELVTMNKLETGKNKQPVVIDVEIKAWSYEDDKYWKAYFIDQDRLKKFKAYPIFNYWINGQLKYNTNYNDICYGYYGGFDKIKKIHLWQLYHPYRKEVKFITNYAALRATSNIKIVDFGVLTKAVKDVIVLDLFDVNSCALSAESIVPTYNEIKKLNHFWKKKHLLTDFDHAGVKIANKLKKDFNPMFLTNGHLNTINYHAKDISDFIKYYGYNTTKELINYLVEEQDYNSLDYFDFIKQLKIGNNT